MSEEQKKLDIKVPESKPKRAPTLYFIVVGKFLKGATALLLALGAIRMTDNLPEDFRRLLEFLHLDPESRFFQDLADRVNDISPEALRRFAVGSMLYGLIMLVQAVGLGFRVSWAVWLVIGESAFFIPIEVYELIRRHTPGAEVHPHFFGHPRIAIAIILAINVGIVWYLFKNRDRLIKHYGHH